jgi:hypothetical protein
MSQLEFNRQTYLDLAKAQGIERAVNQLHQDLWQVELVVFDTPEGFQAGMWDTLNEMRIFSRELWDLNLDQ